MRAMVRGAHFLAVAAMSAVGAAPGAVDEGLLASYDLLRADCVNGTFPDGAGAGGPLVRTASTRCLHGLGVAADGAAPRVTAGAAALRCAAFCMMSSWILMPMVKVLGTLIRMFCWDSAFLRSMLMVIGVRGR